MVSRNPVIQIFLKAPRAGFVKTRLADAIGEDCALAVYGELVEGQLRRLPRDWPVQIHFTPSDAEDAFRSWLGPDYSYHPQPDGGLGERLSHAVSRSFDTSTDPVICIGADCPALSACHLEDARDSLLNGTDVVFGPTPDGGYYLIGMSRYHAPLFNGIPWSTEHTLNASLQVTRRHGLRTGLLPELHDVDTVRDLQQVIDLGLLPHSLLPKNTEV